MHLEQKMLRALAAATTTAVIVLGTGAPALATTTPGGATGQSTTQDATTRDATTQRTTTPQAESGRQRAADNRARAERRRAQTDTPVAGARRQGPRDEDTGADGTTTDENAVDGSGEEKASTAASGNATDKSLNGDGHTPVTVCHRLGSGEFIPLTFDENALEAHLEHGDKEYDPAGCGDGDVRMLMAARTRSSTGTPGDGGVAAVQVLGVEAERAADALVAPAASVAPAAGILPATGAGDYTVPLLAGVGLLAAGTALLARRRLQGTR